MLTDRIRLLDRLERFRNYDQFKDYFTDIQNTIEDVIHFLTKVHWSSILKAGKYI